jgi:hypothetical protein
MSNAADTRLESIDPSTLSPLVRDVLDSETAEVVRWNAEPIHASRTEASTYRLSGEAHDGDETVPWSLILKIIGRVPNRDDPSAWNYWKREVLAYQSGLLDEVPGSLAAPGCLDVVEHPGDEFWLWLEEVTDDIGPDWPLEHYGIVARHLGQFNGAYVMGHPVPSKPWLSRGWLRSQLARPEASAAIAQLRQSLEQPLVQRVYPNDVTEDVARIWAEREQFVDALESFPQTLCHFDAFRRNLFAQCGTDGNYQTVAIDWSFTGTGTIGEEIAPLVAATLSFREVDWCEANELDALVFEGYLKGLRDAGWRGDPHVVRFGYAVSSAVRYGVGHTGGVLSLLMDDSERAQWAQVMGCSMGEVVDNLGQWLRFLHSLGDEARELLGKLS